MKKIYIILLGALLFSCNDDFLERYPQTEMTEKNFFNNVTDLKTYSYQFYDYLSTTYWDRPSDNTTIYKGSIRGLMQGTVTADNVGGWNKGSWSRLRSINYLLDNYAKATGDETEKLKYGAMGHFHRALFYIDKVKTYSDVPWYSTVLQTTDESLYKPRDTREQVVDSIIADLEFATKNLQDEGDKTLLSKWVAYTQLARFCLYEGTYRKYHAGEVDLHVTKDPEYFLNKAVKAANEVMGSGKFSIQTGDIYSTYADLFNGGADLQASPEILMYIKYEQGKRSHGAELVLEFENGVSRTMADSYLNLDGTFVPSSITDTLQLNYAFEGRDPRMIQSLFYPGYQQPNENNPHKLALNKTGGYGQIKFMPKEKGSNWDGYMTVVTDLPLYRYAEVLLIYAEAKAELGQLTQDDLDKTVNVLRDRVGVAHMTMNPPVDPFLQEMYPNVSGSQMAEILEIRRERNVELFAEGFRYTDMMRWKIGKIFEKPQQGIYVPSTGLVDVTGDGQPDYFISDDGSNMPSDLPSDATIYITNEGNVSIYLENGKSGHIMFAIDQGDMGTFIEPKYYYRPVPTSELLLNPNLGPQLFGWN